MKTSQTKQTPAEEEKIEIEAPHDDSVRCCLHDIFEENKAPRPQSSELIETQPVPTSMFNNAVGEEKWMHNDNVGQNELHFHKIIENENIDSVALR